MKTIDRYVAREFARLFLLFILAAPLLFILGDYVEKIDTYSDRMIPLTSVALSYLYQMPMFIGYSLPVAALIATVFTVNAMSRHAEMTAAKASGISFFRALAVLPVLGIVLTALGLVLTEVVPMGTLAKKEVLGEVETAAEGMRHDFVYTGPEGHVFSIRRLTMTGPSLSNVTIEQGEPSGTMTHVTAQEALYDETRGWTLLSGVYRIFDETGAESAFRFDSMQIRAFDETPEALMARTKEPEEMRYEELGRFIESLQRSGGTPLELMVERAQKLALPAAAFIIVLLGAPLANTSARGGAAYGIGISLGITIFYLMLFKLLGAAGKAGMLDPMVAAWTPNVLFLVAALVLLARVRT